MKKISIALSLLALTGSQVQTVSAGEQEWATAGKVLTGLFAAQAVASVFAPPPVYQTTVYYPGGPVYSAAPAYVVAQPPAYVQPAPVYVAQPPVAYYAPPAYVQPYPGYYYAPRPVFSFNFGFGGCDGYDGYGGYGGHHGHGYSGHHGGRH